MGQSLVKNLVHLVYSTKYRKPIIPESCENALWAYQAGTFRNHDSPAIIIGGVEDHVHALFSLSKNHALKAVVEEVKKSSSKWMKKQTGNRDFYWQGGYSAFSVSQSQLETVRRYIGHQREHHKTMTFQEELRTLYKKYAIEFDENLVWN